MSKFKQIDLKLERLANKLNARLTKDRPTYPEVLRTFEERRIDWQEDKINKAIIIQPNFEHSGVNLNIWNFIIVAWFEDTHSLLRLKWIKKLVDKDIFEEIEKNIDKLLYDSEITLKKINKENLK